MWQVALIYLPWFVMPLLVNGSLQHGSAQRPAVRGAAGAALRPGNGISALLYLRALIAIFCSIIMADVSSVLVTV